MKKIFKSIPLFIGITILAACGGKNDQKATDDSKKVTYSYDANSSKIEWTSFKYESKAPVKGTFKSINVTSINNAEDVKTFAESLTFAIPVSSVSTQDESRDAKIIQFFFKVMSTDELKGRIVKLTDDGIIELEVTMNGITGIVSGNYKIEGTHFSFTATMDMAKWQAQKAIDTLNENCKANHTENGVTKVWTEVDLSFSTDVVANK